MAKVALRHARGMLEGRETADMPAPCASGANARNRPRRDASELLPESFAPKTEGVGNAGCPMHPQPRVRTVVVNAHEFTSEFTGIDRRSRTQWF
jgi:hypothetical protein